MPLSWNELQSETEAGEKIAIAAVCGSDSPQEQRMAVNEMVDKTVELLPLEVRDESMYLVFTWDAAAGQLSAAVAGEGKLIHGEREVSCQFAALAGSADADVDGELFETIRFWVRDYLTTCNEYMRFSLIAILHSGDVRRAVLL